MHEEISDTCCVCMYISDYLKIDGYTYDLKLLCAYGNERGFILINNLLRLVVWED